MLNKVLEKQRLVLIVAAGLLGPVPGAADPPGAWPAPETFRDWRLDCPAAACAAHTAVVGADGSEVLRLVLRPRPRPALAVTTPLPLFLPDGVTLVLGEAPPRQVPWRTCGAGGCEATLPLDPDLLDALKRERAGSLGFTLVDGVRVRIPVSLMGLSAAVAARDR
jgi:invasion protein IalB